MPDSSPPSKPLPSCNFDAHNLNLKLSVTLSADPDAVDSVVRNIMRVVREMKCADGREDDIELALSEALANAVVHGAGLDPSKTVECDVACDEEHGMLIVVRPRSGLRSREDLRSLLRRKYLFQPRPRHLPDQSVDG